MTSYLDETWLQAEIERFEESKKSLQLAAALLEKAATAAPQLQRDLEQLDQKERQTKKSIEQLVAGKRQEMSALVKQGQQNFDEHVQQTLNGVSELGDTGKILGLSQDVSQLSQKFPLVERQILQISEQVFGLKDESLKNASIIERQIRGIQDTLGIVMYEQSMKLDKKAVDVDRLNQILIQDDNSKKTLDQLSSAYQELHKSQQQLQSYQQSQGRTMQRITQELSELENTAKRELKELVTTVGQLEQRTAHVLSRLEVVEKRQTALETKLMTLETELPERLLLSQQQFEEKLLSQFEAWRMESQHIHQGLGQQVNRLAALPQQVATMDIHLKELQSHLESHQRETIARHEAQREALADLVNQMKAGQNRVTRFMVWFEKAGTMARMTGKPE